MKLKLACFTILALLTITNALRADTNVLCTTFPIYQITRNVAKGRVGINVALLGLCGDFSLNKNGVEV
jgi:ABC-type Zn uptake system ZnuABC Zn-binding protein ZnuA